MKHLSKYIFYIKTTLSALDWDGSEAGLILAAGQIFAWSTIGFYVSTIIIFIEFINKTGIFHVIYNTMNNVETVLFVDITSAYVKTPVIIKWMCHKYYLLIWVSTLNS